MSASRRRVDLQESTCNFPGRGRGAVCPLPRFPVIAFPSWFTDPLHRPMLETPGRRLIYVGEVEPNRNLYLEKSILEKYR